MFRVDFFVRRKTWSGRFLRGPYEANSRRATKREEDCVRDISKSSLKPVLVHRCTYIIFLLACTMYMYYVAYTLYIDVVFLRFMWYELVDKKSAKLLDVSFKLNTIVASGECLISSRPCRHQHRLIPSFASRFAEEWRVRVPRSVRPRQLDHEGHSSGKEGIRGKESSQNCRTNRKAGLAALVQIALCIAHTVACHANSHCAANC